MRLFDGYHADISPKESGRQRLSLVVLVFCLVFSLIPAATSLAQDATPPVGEAAPDASQGSGVVEPPGVQDAPAPIDAPVPVEVPAEPAAIPAEAPATDIADPTVPAPAAEPPASTLAFAPSIHPTCSIAPDGPSSVADSSAIEYVCTDHVNITALNLSPSAVNATWTFSASVKGGWDVSLLPPVNDPLIEAAQWTPAGNGHASFTFAQTSPLGTSADATDINTLVQIEFRLRVHRAACSVEAQTVRVDHAIEIGVMAPNAAVTALPAHQEPLLISPDLTSITEPTIAFDGPLAFGKVGVDATGVIAPVRSGSVSVTVSGLDSACGQWMLRTSATPLVDADGAPLEGSQLVIVTINDEPIPDGACDLANGCDVIAMTAGPDAEPSQTFVLGLELRIPEQPALGSFGTSLDAELTPVGDD